MGIPAQVHLFTIDIDSLYNNTDTEMGLGEVKTVMDMFPDGLRPNSGS